MRLEGEMIRLRAVEPEDVEALYCWENDPSVWGVSGTLAPFSRHALERFVQEQQFDPFQSRQQRLIIECLNGRAVGVLDLFEIDPLNRRAGIGILIHRREDRREGYAREALELAIEYVHSVLNLKQLWCNIESDNPASLALFRGRGFRPVGVKQAWNWSPEGWKDEILFQYLIPEAE